MNKCLRQNWKIFNQIYLRPINMDMDNINDEYCEKIWNHLVNDDLERHVIYNRKTKGNKYTISVWSDNEYAYIVQVIRTEYNTDNTTIFMQPLCKDLIQDFLAIAKMIHYNINNIIGGMVDNVHEFNEMTYVNDLGGKVDA